MRGMRVMATEKAKIAIVAAIGVHKEERVEKKLHHSSSSRLVDECAPATGANG